MFERLFVAAVLGAGGPAAPPAPHSAATEAAFGDTHLQVALGSPDSADKTRLLEAARARYERALKQNPGHKAALFGVARATAFLGDRPAAAFARYLAAHPADAAAHHEAALAHARFGDWAAAVERCESAVRLDPTHRQYGTTLGFCLARTGRWDDAHAALLRVMPADEARTNLAVARQHAAATARQPLPRPAEGTDRFDLTARVRVGPPAPTVEKERIVALSCVAADRVGPFVEVLPVAPAPREVPVVTAAYHLRNVAAGDVTAAVGAALGGTGREVRVDVRAAENQLVVTGSPATHARVVTLVGELDRNVPQVHVSMTIAEVPVAFLTDCGLTKAGAGASGCFSLKARERELFAVALRNYPGSSVLSRPDILVRDNQTGYVAVGQDFPVVTPVAPGGAVVPAGTVDTHLVGVSVCVTPRIMPDGKVTLRVEPRTCSPAPTPVVVRAGATAFPFHVQTVQMTVLAASGETVVLAMEKTGADGKPVALLVVLTPTARP